MSANYEASKVSSVGRYEYFASDVSGAPLEFKRTAADVLSSRCGRYQVVRWDIGHGDFVFDANVILPNGKVECIGFESSTQAAKRACELHAGRLHRATTPAAAA